MKYLKRFFAVFLLILLVFVQTGCSAPSVGKNKQSEQAAFDQFLEEQFKETVTSDSITLHYTLKNPEAYQITNFTPTFGDLNLDTIKEDETKLENTYKKLSNFRYNRLTDDQQITYDVLKKLMETQLKAKGLTFYQNILSPTIGLQAQLPVLLAEYYFDSEQDIDNYLSLLSTLDTYFNQIIAFEEEKSKKGLFMSDDSVDDIVSQCTEFIADPNKNLLIGVFNDRIDKMNTISESDKQLYKDQNKNIVLSVVIPAYKHLSDSLNALKGTGKNSGGLCNFNHGKEYYEYLVADTTGSDLSVNEMKKLITKRLSTAYENLQNIMLETPDAFQYYGSEDYKSTDPAILLQYLKEQMVKEYPTAPDINYQIKTVDSSLADHLSPAFYLTPPIDDAQDNNIYINSLSKSFRIESLYSTLAHEGYPGHLYQTTYYQALNPSPIRCILNFGGYSEGWATYVEYHSYELIDFGKYDTALTRLNQVDTELNLNICSRIDIGVNYEGWDQAKTKDFLANYGLNDDETVQQIYHSVIEEPANYLQYYIGFLEFETLRETAKNKLSDKFDPIAFHKAILDIGPAPFSIITDAVDNFIRENQ